MKSEKELSLERKIVSAFKEIGQADKALAAAKIILADEEIQSSQEFANNVSIVRLGFNDHGPVHMRIVVLNAIIMMGLLRQAGIKTNLEQEGVGDFEDSLISVILAAMLHDLGMGIGRQDHELKSTYLAIPILNRLLSQIFPDDMQKKVMIRATALEGISGHMGSRVNSLEAGIVQLADGCDMSKGRARIPIALSYSPRAGDIHQYSANSIKAVNITKGAEKPIHIDVMMSSEVGLFQVEEVLLTKIAHSPAKQHIELYAQVNEEEPRRYL